MLLVHHRRFVGETASPLAQGTQGHLGAAGKLQGLTHEVDRCRENILGLCEMRWKNFGETTTDQGHMVFFSGKKVINRSMTLDFFFTRTS